MIRTLIVDDEPLSRRKIREFLKDDHEIEVVGECGSVLVLKTDEIAWISAEENYVRLYCGKASYLLRDKISNLESQLATGRIQRIHRSTIMNSDRIQKLHPHSRGDYQVGLHDGTEL